MHLLSFSVHRCLLVLCVFSFSLLSHAQDDAAFVWGRGISGNGTIWSSGTADAAGNVYTVGSFTGDADFDPGPNARSLTSMGYTDAFISKLDANGNYAWVIQLGSTNNDDINAVEVDAQGNVYVVGYVNGPVDFDPGPGVVTFAGQSFVAKYNGNGNLIWVSAAAGGTALAVDANENIYLTGREGGNIIINAYDIYICKLNSNGALQWKEWIASNLEDFTHSIAVDGNGNVILGGSFTSPSLDLDPGPGVYTVTKQDNGVNVFLLKVDPSGNFLWGGALTAENPYDIITDASNNIYITGLYEQTADFDPGPGTYLLTAATHASNTFVCKLNESGNLVWVKEFRGNAGNYSFGQALALDAAGNIYTSGYMTGIHDMDPGPNEVRLAAVGAGGPFISKLDANGNYRWAKMFGGTDMAQSYGIGVDAAQNVYTTGFFRDTIDLDPGPDKALVTAPRYAQGIFINKLAPIVGAPLPLTWLSVKGELNSGQQATLHWQADESNVQGYTIEKSIDGRTFTAIGSVTAKGNGTNSYEFTEQATLQQTAWYRILQMDPDGHSSYSTIIRIAAGNARTTVSIYPVPAREYVTISITGDELLQTKALLIDGSGRLVKAIYLNKQQTRLPLGNLAPGLYFLQLANGQTMTIMRQD